VGIFAAAFMKRFPLIPVEDRGGCTTRGCARTSSSAFLSSKMREFIRSQATLGGLVEFHARHKLLVMAHSPKHLSALGRLVGNAKGYGQGLGDAYIETLMEGLRLIATSRKNTNFPSYRGLLQEGLERRRQEELLEVIEWYHRGLIPLVVPVTLLNHYARRYDKHISKASIF
jgi:uncharacterized protein YbgA (DUF1722 family)